jgi:hypothetical protein
MNAARNRRTRRALITGLIGPDVMALWTLPPRWPTVEKWKKMEESGSGVPKKTARRDMTISERIHEKLRGLPGPLQKEVLDFVEYLAQKLRKEDEEWSQLSVATALRGLEEEQWPQYHEGDLKEKWQ